MATRLAILATAKAILKIVADSCPAAEFPGAEFRLLQAADFASPQTLSEGGSVLLYQVVPSALQRNTPGRRTPGGRSRPPLAIDLHFLITPLSGSAETQLSMLGWILRALEDTPILTAGLLNAAFPGEVVFSPTERVDLVSNSLSTQDTAALWAGLGSARAIPSLTYVARAVMIEAEGEPRQGETR